MDFNQFGRPVGPPIPVGQGMVLEPYLTFVPRFVGGGQQQQGMPQGMAGGMFNAAGQPGAGLVGGVPGQGGIPAGAGFGGPFPSGASAPIFPGDFGAVGGSGFSQPALPQAPMQGNMGLAPQAMSIGNLRNSTNFLLNSMQNSLAPARPAGMGGGTDLTQVLLVFILFNAMKDGKLDGLFDKFFGGGSGGGDNTVGDDTDVDGGGGDGDGGDDGDDTTTTTRTGFGRTDGGGGRARVWGDPHVVDDDGGQFDFMGQKDKVFAVLSDSNVQVNSRFKSWNRDDITVMGDIGIQVGNDVSNDGVTKIEYKVGNNTTPVLTKADGTTVELEDGQEVVFDTGLNMEDGTPIQGYAVLNGRTLTVNTGEYIMKFNNNGSHMNLDETSITNIGVQSDGRTPEGFLGEVLGDGEADNGRRGAGAQGEGALKGGVEDYKIQSDDLFGTDFAFNVFNEEADKEVIFGKAAGGNAQAT